jgi:hypothetical protein
MKITLATLPQADRQQILNQVAAHLKAQGEQCLEGGLCCYRNAQGQACAAGALMSDDEANALTDSMRKCTWDELVTVGIAPPHYSELIEALQEVHDECPPDKWQSALEFIAHRHGLSLDWNAL